MKDKLNAVKSAAIEKIQSAASTAELNELRVQYLGKKSELQGLLKQMGGLSLEERPVMGQLVNPHVPKLKMYLKRHLPILKTKKEKSLYRRED